MLGSVAPATFTVDAFMEFIAGKFEDFKDEKTIKESCKMHTMDEGNSKMDLTRFKQFLCAIALIDEFSKLAPWSSGHSSSLPEKVSRLLVFLYRCLPKSKGNTEIFARGGVGEEKKEKV